MAIRFDQFGPTAAGKGMDVGIEDHDIVEMAAAFRRFGYWRIDLDTALFHGTADIFSMFGIAWQDGPINLIEFRDHIHSEDLPMLMQCFERTTTRGQMYHVIYRIRAGNGDYKYVRTVGKFREKPGTSGEIIGITYEFFERLRTVAFLDDTAA